MMKKAQVSMEFLMIIGVAALIFIIILGLTFFRKTEISETETYLDAASECTKFSNLINEVYMAGEGTEVKLKTDYLVSFHNSSTISINDVSRQSEFFCVFYAKSFPKYNLTGSLLIKNSNRRVLIENV